MTPRRPAGWWLSLLVTAALSAAGAGCAEKPYLSAGNAYRAEVGYTSDLRAATEVAREHCARYEKVARYLESNENIAYFACEKP
jgi:hypothetical protein